MSVIIQKNKSKQDLINFHNAACFSPSISTYYKAVKNGNFQSWPGLTPELDSFPVKEDPNESTNQMMATIVPYHIAHKAFGDLPGRFPHTSSRGSQYFLVIYQYDRNGILVKTLKHRSALEIKHAYMEIYKLLAKRGCAPKTFLLDNKTSATLLNVFEKENMTYQLVPPHIHRRNAAKKAIAT